MANKKSTEKINFRGKKYNHLSALCRAYGIPYGTIKHRMTTGNNLEEAISYGKSKNAVTVFGVSYRSKVEMTVALGISLSMLERHMERTNKSLEEGVQYCLKRSVTFQGKVYPTITELAGDYGIQPHLIVNRLRRGLSLYDAVKIPRDTNMLKHSNSITYKGENYPSKVDLATHFGYNTALVDRVKDKYNLTFENALDFLEGFFAKYPNRPKIISSIPHLIYNGKWYKDLKEFSRDCNVQYLVFTSFCNRNKISNPIEGMQKLTTANKTAYRETGTGFINQRVYFVEKYNKTFESLVRNNKITKVQVKTYPECSFKIEGYCAFLKKDFEVYTEKTLKEKNN